MRVTETPFVLLLQFLFIACKFLITCTQIRNPFPPPLLPYLSKNPNLGFLIIVLTPEMANLIDEYGNPIQLTDEHGHPVQLRDEFGNPMHLTGVASTSPSPTLAAVMHADPTPPVASYETSGGYGGEGQPQLRREEVMLEVSQQVTAGGGGGGGELARSGSSSSSSSEDDGQGGRRKKKGLTQKIKEKFSGGKDKTEQPHITTTGAATTTTHHEHEKKSVMEKIKEKLPGHHNR